MTYMKILLLLMFCTVLPMQAQQMKKLTDLKDFEARLLQEAKNIESIESNFTQIKYLDVTFFSCSRCKRNSSFFKTLPVSV